MDEIIRSSEELADEVLPDTAADEDTEDLQSEPSVNEMLMDDLAELKEEFCELQGINDIAELHNPTRYAALRDLGLTPKEAYLATSVAKKADTRSHLRGGVPHIAKSPVSSMTRREWQIARALFEDMTDSDIEKLYRKVTR